jgi:mRNA-degrading endonuclease RelE of RelBE toxin-antitoxin system
MKLELVEGAVEDLKQFDKEVQKLVRDRIEELRNNPLNENTSLLSKQGLEIFRLKLKTDRLDHRVFFDLDEGKVVVLGIEHRDQAYTPESIRKIKSRQ